jgi:trimeric autotransporter adhesin
VVEPGGVTSSSVAFTITSASELMIVTSSPLPGGTAGVQYSQSLAATRGATPYNSWIVTAGSLPPGITLTTLNGDGFLNGVPTSAGSYSFTAEVTDSSNARAFKQFSLTINPTVSISTGGIVNSASYVSGSVAPGEVVTIYGSGMGPNMLANAQLDSQGFISTSNSGTQVLFDGVAAPIIYTQAAQVSVVVPYEVSGKLSTLVQVMYQGQTSNATSVAVSAVMLGIFTNDSSGSGEGSIFNQDGSANSSKNPASVGSYVSVYATGEGQTNPGGIDGKPASSPAPMPVAQPITATVGGVPAAVQYAGGSPGSVAGLLQVNVQIPQGVAPGNAVPIVISLGGQHSQGNVTLAIK